MAYSYSQRQFSILFHFTTIFYFSKILVLFSKARYSSSSTRDPSRTTTTHQPCITPHTLLGWSHECSDVNKFSVLEERGICHGLHASIPKTNGIKLRHLKTNSASRHFYIECFTQQTTVADLIKASSSPSSSSVIIIIIIIVFALITILTMNIFSMKN